jgi:hypothetical protein
MQQNQPEEVQQPQPEEMQQNQPEEVQQPQPEEMQQPQPEEVQQPQPEEVKHPQPEEVKQPQPEEVHQPQPEEAPFTTSPTLIKQTSDTITDPVEELASLGYMILKGESPGDYGVLRQVADNTKGIEWKGQENYDRIGSLIYKYI